MTWGLYGSYVLFVLLVLAVPGPDTAVVLKSSLAGGTRGGVLASVGIGAGNLTQGVAAALGLSALITRSEPVFLTLRWAGAAYLCYLGVRALIGAWRGDYRALEPAQASGGRYWRQGLLCNLTNPKVLVFYVSMLPQFLSPSFSVGEALLLAGTVATMATLWQLVLVFFVHRVRAWLGKRKVRRALDGVTGTALVGFGAALAFDN
ncbi:resistance to homoserine/threonine (RhtB) family protein [Amycolatopsis xylanica]|uniref:Resistance to homoserine/threonine (RhtB) family protein n=1 Tax=Amycolatopsis xylanica TaxID=589385 RepID=A0A1H3DPR3_9PSEU|nr:LysE family transporter [Amycolatopsis xylanica]SDX67649.1 resistance to homoserine/threonine (RhtB) family protein [Amycolatopsis xylanica]